jgi:hypothetical protein
MDGSRAAQCAEHQRQSTETGSQFLTSNHGKLLVHLLSRPTRDDDSIR